MSEQTSFDVSRSFPVFFGITRIVLGWIFLWAFLDKVFGWGFTTAADKTWLDGVSPTVGFLKFAAKGPFAGIFHAIAGNVVVDWLFMLGLLCVGVALIVGIGVRIAGYAGALLMIFMWLAVLPPKNNPVVDEHIVYLFLLLMFANASSGAQLGLGTWWKKTSFVRRYPFLQ